MRNRILIAVAVTGVAVLFWAFWLLPSGEGEYRDSPDGLWRAHVSGLSRGTLLGSRRRYVELSIERLTDGATMWRQQILHTSADTVPAYGDRSARFISWSPDSLQFTVGTTNGATLTVPLTVAKNAQQDGAANRSQPIRAETNRTSVAAGSDR
ncbi:MAG: hypothetical protein ACTHLW_06405 [Verrucomicrobiota bacterium]